MRKFPATFMRGGTSKGLMFLESDLPPQDQWTHIFNQCMGNPNPSQIDGMGGCFSSNNKIIVVRKSQLPNVDIEYLVVQSVVGSDTPDYKSNCGNMTAGTAPYAVEMGLVENLTEPTTNVRMLNLNTNKRIDVEVPVKDDTFYNEGDCAIAGIDGVAGELKVNFLDPAGSKTGKLFPLDGQSVVLDTAIGQITATVLDVANPLVLVHAADVGATGTEMPGTYEIDSELGKKLEAVRSAACFAMGLATSPEDATKNNPGVPKIAFFSAPQDYTTIDGTPVKAEEMDVCLRVVSVFQGHKSTPLTTACAVGVATKLPQSVIAPICGVKADQEFVRIGHPSGTICMYPHIKNLATEPEVTGVAVARTARRIMDGTIYIQD